MMSKLLVVLVFVVASVSTYAYAQEAVFTLEQKEEARVALQMLGQALGVVDVKPSTEGFRKDVSTKTMAGVADKALDAVTNAVTAIAGKMEQVAPKVWEVMVRQQYAKAVGETILPLGVMILFLIYMLISRRVLKKYPVDAKYWISGDPSAKGWAVLLTTILPTFIILISGIKLFEATRNSAMYIINPEYYAVKDLLQMLLNPSSL